MCFCAFRIAHHLIISKVTEAFPYNDANVCNILSVNMLRYAIKNNKITKNRYARTHVSHHKITWLGCTNRVFSSAKKESNQRCTFKY